LRQEQQVLPELLDLRALLVRQVPLELEQQEQLALLVLLEALERQALQVLQALVVLQVLKELLVLRENKV
jgi:hypothetical protein